MGMPCGLWMWQAWGQGRHQSQASSAPTCHLLRGGRGTGVRRRSRIQHWTLLRLCGLLGVQGQGPHRPLGMSLEKDVGSYGHGGNWSQGLCDGGG